uniref:BED-type domain-containing protein n=1 Tax=Chenopodium quinoa TaxID=63459 RepID=A0A803MYS9_CHEQI
MSEYESERGPMDCESDVGGNGNATNKQPKVGDNRKTELWNHYWDIRDPETNKIVQVKCKYCEKLLTGNTNNGTSSLKKHLNSCPKFPANIDKKQKLISVFRASPSDTTVVSNWEFDQNSCRLALAKMVIVDEQPFSVVEREGFRYFCHDGLSSVKTSIARIRSAVRYMRSSPSQAKLFAHSFMLVKVSCKGSVCLDVSTRWNSTFIMLETALKFEKAFNRFKEDDPDFSKELKDGVPTKEDWVNAKVLALCLKQFYESTKKMSGSLYVTSNMHVHEILGVLNSLIEWETSTNIDIRVVDPRYKLRFLKYSFKKLYPNDYAKVDVMCDDFMDNNGQENLSSSNNEQMKKFYDEFDEEEGECVVEKCELNNYLEEVREQRVEGDMFDILQWWKEKSEKYKVLATMAKDILAIPVSTVSSESAFSTSGRVLDQFRISLGPKTMEALVCAQDWLRASNISVDIEHFLEDVEKYEEELDDSGLTQVDDILGNN